jgi:hypothetical protein
MEFDESALAKLLKQNFSGEEAKAEQNVDDGESIDDGSASAETEGGQADDPTAEQTENQDESPGDVVSEDGNEDETDSNGVRKRIDKLTRQKKEALERVEALERELEEAKASKPAAASAVVQDDSQFGGIWDVGKLSDEWTKARQLKRWCEDNADGCDVDGKEYSAEDVKQIRRRVEDAIDVHIPERARFLQSYQSLQPVVQQLYPWWKDQKSVEYTVAQDVLRQMPQLRRLPEHQVLIGDFLEGRKLRMEREAAKGVKPRVPLKAPPQPGKPMAAPLRKDPAKTQLQAATKKFRSTGTQTELAQLLKRMI